MEELNKKLAEWAGLDLKWGRLEGKDYGKMVLVFNDANGYRQETQAFTQSLDACFKWLVPKVVGGDSYTIDMRTEKYQTWAHLIAHYYMDKSYDVQDKDPALALCKAIEKLIEGEKDA